MAIAIEAFVFSERLKLSRRASLEYSASLNLLSTALGWLFFFSIEPLLPQYVKNLLIGYILFNIRSPNINTLLILLGLMIFFGTFLVELQGLELLRLLLKEKTEAPVIPPKIYKYRTKRERRALSQVVTNQATTILIANAYSYSAILLVLIARSLARNFPVNG